MPDFLADKRQEIDSRLKELKPQVQEYRRLEAAVQALAEIPSTSAPSPPPSANGRRRGPGRPRGSKSAVPRVAKPAQAKGAAKAARKAGGRRKGSGRRAAEALALIQATPGITIPELAVKMGIKKTYLYTVLPNLAREGSVKKDGRGWRPASAAIATE
jgi:hypothetical protein